VGKGENGGEHKTLEAEKHTEDSKK